MLQFDDFLFICSCDRLVSNSQSSDEHRNSPGQGYIRCWVWREVLIVGGGQKWWWRLWDAGNPSLHSPVQPCQHHKCIPTNVQAVVPHPHPLSYLRRNIRTEKEKEAVITFHSLFFMVKYSYRAEEVEPHSNVVMCTLKKCHEYKWTIMTMFSSRKFLYTEPNA